MIGRIIALGVALSLVSIGAAWADEPVDREEIVIPTSRPARAPVEQPVTAPPPPYVSIESTSVGAGIGVSWGDGTISFEGRSHPFSLKGVGLGEIGASRASATGDVRNLDELSDFAGHYVAVGAGAAAGVGVSAVTMRNEHGVVITLKSTLRGVGLSLGPEGLSIALD